MLFGVQVFIIILCECVCELRYCTVMGIYLVPSYTLRPPEDILEGIIHNL